MKRVGVFEVLVEFREVESGFRILVVTIDAGILDKGRQC